MTTVVDKRVEAFLHKRGFYRPPEGLTPDGTWRTYNTYIGKVGDYRVSAFMVFSACQNTNPKFPIACRISVNDSYQNSVRIAGKFKWIVLFDDAVRAAILICNKNELRTNDENVKRKAEELLNDSDNT